MSKTEMIRELINQNNTDIGWFIAIIIGSIVALLGIFGFLEKKLSDSKINRITNGVKISVFKEMVKQNTEILNLINTSFQKAVDLTNDDFQRIINLLEKGDLDTYKLIKQNIDIEDSKYDIKLSKFVSQEINTNILKIKEKIQIISPNEIISLLIDIHFKVSFLEQDKYQNIGPIFNNLNNLFLVLKNSKFISDEYVKDELRKIYKLSEDALKYIEDENEKKAIKAFIENQKYIKTL